MQAESSTEVEAERIPDAEEEKLKELLKAANGAPLLDFLQTDRGYELGRETIDWFKTMSERLIDRGKGQHKVEQIVRLIGIVVIVLAVGILGAFGKLDPAAGTLLGTVAGYLLAKKPSDDD